MVDENQDNKEKTEPYYLAKEFSWTHFIKPLIDCKRLVRIAKLGYEDISEISLLNKDQISFNKINAITNLLHELNSLCADCEFIMDSENFKLVKAEKDKIQEVESVIDGISKESGDLRTGHSEIHINIEHFNNCLNQLIDVTAKIKIPINNIGIIYPKGDKFNFDTWANSFEQGGG